MSDTYRIHTHTHTHMHVLIYLHVYVYLHVLYKLMYFIYKAYIYV